MFVDISLSGRDYLIIKFIFPFHGIQQHMHLTTFAHTPKKKKIFLQNSTIFFFSFLWQERFHVILVLYTYELCKYQFQIVIERYMNEMIAHILTWFNYHLQKTNGTKSGFNTELKFLENVSFVENTLWKSQLASNSQTFDIHRWEIHYIDWYCSWAAQFYNLIIIIKKKGIANDIMFSQILMC